MQTFNDAMNWLNNRLTFGIKPGLDRMKFMLEKLGNPERRLKTIHVGGTNGKGSTISFMRTILQEEGYRVGTFTSPFVETFNERISINGHPISDEDFLQVVKEIMPIVTETEQTDLGAPTEFEVLTVISLYYFAKVEIPDIVLYEVGLGGRLDSTNIIHPILSIITSIGHDHMNILGNTLPEIAKEKAGIIKSGVPVITAVDQEDAFSVIKDTAISQKAKLYSLNFNFHLFDSSTGDGVEQFSFTSPFRTYHHVSISMLGSHQVRNAAVALMAIDYLSTYYSFLISEEGIRSGLKKTFWVGRFEVLSNNPIIIVDGAHNPEGIESLNETLINHYKKDHTIRILFGALQDKQVGEMIRSFNRTASRITFTTFDYPRAKKAKELFEECIFTNKHYEEDWKKAFHQELDQMREKEVLVITGSLYFISQVRNYIKKTL